MCAALTCSADGSASDDPDGTIVSYNWNFGDGAAATGPTAAHGYVAGGTYTVTLTVTDNRGISSSDSEQVQVGTVDQVVDNYREQILDGGVLFNGLRCDNSFNFRSTELTLEMKQRLRASVIEPLQLCEFTAQLLSLREQLAA